MKKNWHPRSWSVQARGLSDTVAYNVIDGSWTLADATAFFQRSYRHPLIVNRAAKRFGRLVRSGKVKEKNA